MKKLLSAILVAALALACVPAMAQTVLAIQPWHLMTVSNGAFVDFDGDGAQEVFTFQKDVDEWGDGSFTLSVNGQFVRQDNCVYLADDVYAMFIGSKGYDGSVYYYASLFMASEYGPSDDPLTYCYIFEDGTLTSVGMIPAMPESMTVDANTGIITTKVRADMIGTWSRPADYMLATGFDWDGDEGYQSYYSVVEIPREIYPCGMIVTTKVLLPLLEDKLDAAYSGTIGAGQRVTIVATDDRRWAYVSAVDGSGEGWVRMSYREDFGQSISVGGVDLHVDDVFDGILYAD